MVKLLFLIATKGSCQVIIDIKKKNKDILKCKAKRDVASSIISDEELYDVVSQYKGIVFGFYYGKHKFFAFGVTHNWVKWSTFWKLLYQKTNGIHHNLDVMHINKNVYDNIFNMIMDVKVKTNDCLE